MEQRSRSSNAAAEDVQIKFDREECALSMEQRSSDVAAKDAQISLSIEVCA